MNLIFIFSAILLLVFNLWTLYNVPVLAVGVKHLLRIRKKKGEGFAFRYEDLPSVTIIVPVKNEEKVVGRLLKALANLNYPLSKKEILVVNDKSKDGTEEICSQYAARYPEIRVLHTLASTTKAAALNFGLKHARGDIIVTFDADSVPEPDVLLKAVKYFKDPAVAAVQGRICSINADENMLTKFLHYEGTLQYEVYVRGKDKLNLFVSLAGTCQFIRREVLEKMGGWNEKSLSEDIELSLRLVEKDYVIRYAPDVQTWEESPNSLLNLVRQRARWYRGNMEMGLKFGVLLKRPSWRRFDAEMTLFGTYLIALCIASYFMAAWSFLIPPNFVWTLIVRFTSMLTLTIIAFAGIGLVCITRPFRLSNLLWLPFVYAYWGFQSFIAIYAILQVLFRRPQKWSKATRSGAVTVKHVRSFLEKR